MLICWIIGHKYVQGDKVFGLIPGTPFCERCGKYAPKKSKENAQIKEDVRTELEKLNDDQKKNDVNKMMNSAMYIGARRRWTDPQNKRVHYGQVSRLIGADGRAALLETDEGKELVVPVDQLKKINQVQ